MSRWFRFYDCALDDPKVQRLPPVLFKVWVNLLCIASRHDGRLPRQDLAFLLRMDEEAAEDAIAKLTEANLIDDTGEALEPHNWNGRQHKSDDSSERVKRHRDRMKRECNGVVTVTVTSPDTETDTETDTDNRLIPPATPSEPQAPGGVVVSLPRKENKKSTKAAKAPAYTGDFEIFWAEYPRQKNTSKAEAFEVFDRLNASDQSAAIEGAIAYASHCRSEQTPERFIAHATTFLRQRRWECAA